MQRTRSIVLTLGAALSCACAALADVTFTGAAGDADLANPKNWDGDSLPTAEDTGVIAFASTCTTSLTVSAALEMKGLTLSAPSGSAVTLSGDATLSLGSGGFVLSGANLYIKVPMAVTAASRWDMGGKAVYSYKTISGTADFAFDNWSGLQLYAAPRYGGNMTMEASGVRSFVYFYEKAAWANTVKITKGAPLFRLSERVPFSTVFPGRKLTHTPWSDVAFEEDVTGCLVMEDGDQFSTSGDFTQFTKGSFEMTGGSFKSGARTAFAGTGGTGSEANNQPVSFLLAGGAFTNNVFALGYNLATNRLVRQTGGEMNACVFHVGGGNSSLQTPGLAEYRLEGGTMTDRNGAAHDRGLVMTGYTSAENARTCTGVFTMTGGEVSFNSVFWGAKGGEWTWNDWSTVPNGRAYGLIDLRGGLFHLPTAGFEFSPMWNSGSVSNSTYDVRLDGGTIVNRADTDVSVAMTVGKGDGPSTWNTAWKTTRVTAPVDGDGTLVKAGEGKLVLTDALRFKGSLSVQKGILEVEGRMTNPEESRTAGQDLVVFAADSLAASLADGDSVTSWKDSSGTVESHKPANGEISTPSSYSAPVFKTAIANGHAGVYFDGKAAALAISASSNPLAGETNFSVAVVFCPTADGVGNVASGNAYAGRTLFGDDRSWSNPGVNTIELIHTQDNRMTLHLRNNSPNTGDVGRSYLVPNLYQGHTEGDKNISVAVISMKGNQVFYNFNNVITNRTFTKVAQSFNPRFQNSSGAKQPLYFGTSDVDGTSAVDQRCFGGYLFEARFYRGKALSEAEMRSVVQSLAVKYTGATTPNLQAPNGPLAATLADTRTAPEVKASDVSWTPEYMVTNFSACSGAYTKPELVTNACNGRSALRFDAAKKTCFNLPGSAGQPATYTDPLAGLKQFAMAFVFRTTTEGTGLADGSVGTGIYSSMLAGFGHGSGCSNASVTFREYGSVGAYVATDGKVWGSLMNPRKPCHLNDGLPHVAVYSGDTETGDFQLMVDGVYVASSLGNNCTWPAYDSNRPHVVGALRAGVGHFTGDIMGFDFWKGTLTEAEMMAYCQKAACDYDFNLKERRAFTADEIATRGLGATNITVASGAIFRVPESATSPYVVKAGAVLSGDGAFEGSYRFGEGAVADFGGSAAKMDDVQIVSGATMSFVRTDLPVDGANVSSVSGAVTVDVTDSAAATSERSHTSLLKIAKDRLAADATFTLVGAPDNAEVVYNEKTGCLEMKRTFGLFIMIK